MALSEAEKKDYSERLDNHLFDGVDIYTIDGERYFWCYEECWKGYRGGEVDHGYESHEKCAKAVRYIMKNSPKLQYAKGMAMEGVQYMRRINA